MWKVVLRGESKTHTIVLCIYSTHTRKAIKDEAQDFKITLERDHLIEYEVRCVVSCYVRENSEWKNLV